MSQQAQAIVLINLGTPDALDSKSVRAYLKEFLNDPRVIDLPKILRWLLVNGIIIPFRYKKSLHAYQQIWTNEGSPLLVNSQKLTSALAAELGPNYHVVLGMRYGHPSIQSAIESIKNYSRVLVIPLFPQYASASTGSALEMIMNTMRKTWNIPEIKIINNFYDNPGFIQACVAQIQASTANQKIERYIFSYHGLPERHVDKSGCDVKCNRITACPQISASNAFCYRAQSYETSRQIADQLNISPSEYVVTFQSRLGRTPWIKPYTDEILLKLRQEGVKHIAVATPSFVSDCLETLEEINIRLRDQWLSLGGETFVYVPCVNDHPLWVKALAKMIQ